MTAPTVTATATAKAAWDTCHRVMNSEWPGGNGDAIREALDGLTGSLETYSLVLNEDIHPASAYGELAGDGEALSRALAMSLKDAADWAAELDRLVPERSEDEEGVAA